MLNLGTASECALMIMTCLWAPFLVIGEQLFKHDPKRYLKLCEALNNYVNIGVPFMRGLWNLPMPYRR